MHLILALIGSALSADLTVNATTTYIYGNAVYDNVQVINGGKLVVTDYDGSSTKGWVDIVADYIYVDATSSIVASGAGYQGVTNSTGQGPGGGRGGSCCSDSGGGGAHGGNGGTGSRDGCRSTDGAGGTAYGSSTSLTVDMGSAGGAAGSADGDSGGSGADGGGGITLEAA